MRLLVNIDVDDLPKAVAFYERAFALQATRRIGPAAVELVGATVPIYLLNKAVGSMVSAASGQVRDFSRHWTPVHFDVVVDDVHAAVGRAVEAGATLEEPIRSSPWGDMALMSDPFGNGFCLLQFVGEGYDAVASPM